MLRLHKNMMEIFLNIMPQHLIRLSENCPPENCLQENCSLKNCLPTPQKMVTYEDCPL